MPIYLTLIWVDFLGIRSILAEVWGGGNKITQPVENEKRVRNMLET